VLLSKVSLTAVGGVLGVLGGEDEPAVADASPFDGATEVVPGAHAAIRPAAAVAPVAYRNFRREIGFLSGSVITASSPLVGTPASPESEARIGFLLHKEFVPA
jgi:hypothetical protein